MDPFSLDHIFSCSSLFGDSLRSQVPLRPGPRGRSSTLRLSGANGQTPRLVLSTATPHSPPAGHSGFLPSLELSKNTSPHLFAALVEVWGLEPQTYGLQSHRSSH